MLQRMKTLAVQSANGTYSSVAGKISSRSGCSCWTRLTGISQTTDFDGIPLFKEYPGNLPPGYVPPEKEGEITLQIGHSEAETLDVERVLHGKQGASFKGYGFHHGG